MPSFTPRDLPDSRIEPTSADLPDSGIKSTSLVSPALAGRFFVFVFVFNYWQPLGNLILVKNPPASAGHRRDTGSVLGQKDSLEVGMATFLQDSCLETPMKRGGPEACKVSRQN